MDKRIIVAGLLLSMLLFAGCLKVEFRENINAQGMSDVTIKMDMSAFQTQPGAEEQDPCEGMTQDPDTPLTNISCTYVDRVVTLTGQLDRTQTDAFTMQDGTYRMDIKKAIESAGGESTGGQSLPENEEQIQQLKAMGLSYDYYVKLPGAIVGQEGGEVQNDGYVKFDVLDLPEGAYVQSTTVGGFDMVTMTIIGAVVVIVVVLVAVLLLKR